jgi:hypothetical protein
MSTESWRETLQRWEHSDLDISPAPTQTSDRTHKALGRVVAVSLIFGLGTVVFLLLFARDLGVDCGWVG